MDCASLQSMQGSVISFPGISVMNVAVLNVLNGCRREPARESGRELILPVDVGGQPSLDKIGQTRGFRLKPLQLLSTPRLFQDCLVCAFGLLIPLPDTYDSLAWVL